jgi:hypothetical protein
LTVLLAQIAAIVLVSRALGPSFLGWLSPAAAATLFI